MNFSLNRFGRLVRRDWLVFQKPLGYGFLAICILLFGIVFYNVQFNEHEALPMSFWINTFTAFLFLGGGMVTSIIFWEFKEPAGRIGYLSLPASHLEKVLSRLIYTFVCYPIVLFAIFFILFKLTELFDGPVYVDMEILPVLNVVVPLFFFGQPLVFMFAIWLNKYVAAKTAIVSCLVMIVAAVIGSLIFRVVFSDQFVGWEMSKDIRIEPPEQFQTEVMWFWGPMLNKLLPVLAMFLFWVVSFFKMKEKQV